MGDKEIKNCFSLFDRDGDGKISVQELGTVVRSLGCTPTEDKVRKVTSECVRGNTFSYDDLCRVMSKLRGEPSIGEEEIREAFKVFDRECNNYIRAAEMRHILTNLGDKLTDEEADEMIRCVDVDADGQFSYEELVMQMVTKKK